MQSKVNTVCDMYIIYNICIYFYFCAVFVLYQTLE